MKTPRSRYTVNSDENVTKTGIGGKLMDLGDYRKRTFFPWTNSILIAVNVLVFCIGPLSETLGMNHDILYRYGVLYAPLLLKGRDFHRLLTAVFLHADAAHLFNNMVVQFAGGNIVEKNLGHVRYLILYILSGIAGNAVSVLSDYFTGVFSFSVGASGAVFGIVGALVYMILKEAFGLFKDRKGDREEGRDGSRLRTTEKAEPASEYAFRSLLIRTGVMTAWLLYSGWSNPLINQAAHVGGMACGFLLAPVLMIGRPRADLEALLR